MDVFVHNGLDSIQYNVNGAHSDRYTIFHYVE